MSRQAGVRIRVRAVLFDMDGVLISSIGSDERSWLRWSHLHGMQGTFSIQWTHGRRAIDTVRALRPDLDPVAEVRRLEDFDAEDHDGATALPGVRDLLTRLKPTQWGIVTSASERLMTNRLRSAGIAPPPALVTADSVSRGKPDPEPYVLGAQKLGLVPAECLVIEDAPAGIRAAKLAGCPALAVASSHSKLELSEADWIVDSLEKVHLDCSETGMLDIQLEMV